MRSRFDRVHVVVPARDEEEHLGATLESVLTAADVVRRGWDVQVEVTVVLDSCTDGSEDVVRRAPGVHAVTVDVGLVGAARAAGVEHATRSTPARSRTWIACADADTIVPSSWLSAQLLLAQHGYDLVVGTVTPDPADLRPGLLHAWRARHQLREGHPHVHGANLGFALAAYRGVGGFASLASGEDVDLVERLRAARVPWRATDRTRVQTSGRHLGRAEAGFAAYLRELETETG